MTRGLEPDAPRARLSLLRVPSDLIAGQAPVRWAMEQLQQALGARGVQAELVEATELPVAASTIFVAGAPAPLAQRVLAAAGVAMPGTPEATALVPAEIEGRRVLLATGSDVRGVVYAVLDLVDRVTYAADALAALHLERAMIEQPANRIRSIMRLFASDQEDKAWFSDREFWRSYLSMLVAQRYNRFQLALGLSYDFPRRVRDSYFYFAYPFLLDVPGYGVRVEGLSEAEREHNLELLRFISGEAHARGLHFQLGLWTHAYELLESPQANYSIVGLTPERHAAYCRDALRLLLETCPAIDGITFRIHGESGVPEGSYDFWRTVFDGAVQCGRRVELDLHAKGIDQQLIDVALQTGLPVTVSPKYWAEHMGLAYHQAWIRPNEQSRAPGSWEQSFMMLSAGSRRFTRYGYADLLRDDRRYGVLFRIWPGTQRLLLWGDPALAAGYGRDGHFCGADGMELFEPLSFAGRRGSGRPGGRELYADASLRPSGGEWEKYRYTYRLVGRLLYNPQSEPDTWRRWLGHEFGTAAAAMEAALAHASRILPLVTTAHLPSAANNAYWPEVYTNMPVAPGEGGMPRRHPYGDTPEPKVFTAVSPLDPQLFSRIDEFVDEWLDGRLSARYSPLEVAAWLDGLATAARQHLGEAQASAAEPGAPGFRRWAVDVTIQCGLGEFFAAKLRAGVEYALYRRTSDVAALSRAIKHYQAARAAWAALAEAARDVYVQDLTFGPEPHLRGHWLDRLAAIDADIADLQAELARAGATAGKRAPILQAAPSGARAPMPFADCSWAVPKTFRRGAPVPVGFVPGPLKPGEAEPEVRLHYRHVNQAEPWRVVAMERAESGGSAYQTAIPADYTDSPYPLQCYFEVRTPSGAALLPGLNETLSNQPYLVITPA